MKISAKTKIFLRLLHKYIGFIFSAFILLLTTTGILLLYPKLFGIDEAYISNSYILKKYNMLNVRDVRKLGKKEDEIFLLDGSLYYKSVFVDKFQNNVTNAMHYEKKNALLVFLKKKNSFLLFR